MTYNDHLSHIQEKAGPVVDYISGLEKRITELEAGIRDAMNALDDMREDGRDEVLVAIPELTHLRKLVTP